MKYSVAGDHVLGLEAVLAHGSVVQFGPVHRACELNLQGVLVGSEGTLAVVTRIWLRLTRNPQASRTMRAIFATVDDATSAISEIIAAGIIPRPWN